MCVLSNIPDCSSYFLDVFFLHIFSRHYNEHYVSFCYVAIMIYSYNCGPNVLLCKLYKLFCAVLCKTSKKDIHLPYRNLDGVPSYCESAMSSLFVVMREAVFLKSRWQQVLIKLPP